MKKFSIISAFTAVVLLGFVSTGCIKETQPTSIATADQVSQSPSALTAAVRGIPAQMATGYLVYGSQYAEFDMGYPGLMITLDSAAGEIIDAGDTGYDWYSYWSSNQYNLGEESVPAWVPWRTQYIFVKSANDVISTIDPETASASQLVSLGQALAFRALFYLNLVRMYECKTPTDPNVKNYSPSASIAGLGVPIVTEKTTLEEARNNPRATVEAVYDQIFSDLDEAEEYMAETASTSSVFPSLAVVYGLKARAYLERGSAGVDGAFASSASYAKKAIEAFGGSPLTQSQWEDPTNGFNNAGANSNSWMWYIHYDAENMGNLCNFVAHMSAQETWTAYGWAVGRGINKSLYDEIPDSDFRKHSWFDPDGYDYYDYQTNYNVVEGVVNPNSGRYSYQMKPYTNIKFHPAQGDYRTYKVGGASDVPLMRIEEMYLIEAEALAMSGDLAGGKAVLNEIIQTRDPEYSCDAISGEFAFQREVFFQKRVELWGEGLIFFDAKRLATGIRNGYIGTNVQEGYRYTVSGVAPWWNFVIPRSEINANPALDGFNNPNPTQTVDEWKQ